MDRPGGSGAPDGDSLEAGPAADLPRVVEIAEAGDLILDLLFENSKATLKSSRKTTPILADRSVNPAKARSRIGFRVDLAILKKQSKYFEKLLGDSRFQEANLITSALEALSIKGIQPKSADIRDLPWVKITDDDEATRLAHREEAFGDMLRVLHGKGVATEPVTLDFTATLAVLADRFDCAAPVSKIMASGLKLKWPVTQRKSLAGEDSKMSRSAENALRQKILISWLLNQPTRFQAATRELIMNGSRKWTAFPEPDDGTEEATWWHLQDGLEQELQFRRECILNTIASVPRHFLTLYTSRARQCQLGYDSSAACDSYQLGEMFKFFTNRGLLFAVDFSPASLDLIADTALLPVDVVLAALRQCPSYQIDKNHMNCGLRTRIVPILDFVKALLSANSVPLSRLPWKNDRQRTAWLPREGAREDVREAKPFQFTRAMSNDQRLRFEHAMGADKFARDVFTAPGWIWTES
ncbi:uncharacterized protein JN550_012544 [Neoarthrinium moseri]|uniref:uncharacterized protein n=1 Tax=Neoarthrinium moseri TaxID=1658444 RepID=UPI001FDC750D|nr:uncharacterized protein JN550_012544 [Neoarthrinium moseri]KAI1858712.1 hypothetical protein JN550_012544 [Neoarthrinium moseri]